MVSYRNPYNDMIKQTLRNIDLGYIDRIQSISETNSFDPTSQLESMVLRHENVHGGSGFAAATLHDMGFEPTNGVTGSGCSGGRIKQTRASTNLAGSGCSGGALLTLQSLPAMHGQPPDTMQSKIAQKASPHKDQQIPTGNKNRKPKPEELEQVDIRPTRGARINGSGKPKRAPTERNLLIKKVMAERGCSLPEASKYIKNNK